jgi:hypothetical protein
MRGRRAAAAAAALLAASGCIAPAGRLTPPAAVLLDSHITGFAMSYCLRSLGDKGLPETDARVLREQGGRWGQVLVEHSRGDLVAAFDVLLPALDAAIASTPMAQVRDDATGDAVPAPVFYCDDLLGHPGVMRAMAEARRRLAAAYA